MKGWVRVAAEGGMDEGAVKKWVTKAIIVGKLPGKWNPDRFSSAPMSANSRSDKI